MENTSDPYYQPRAYRGDDLPSLLDLVTAANADRAGTPYWHVGDVLWQMFLGPIFDPTAHVHLWHGKEGKLGGFAWRDGPGSFVLQTHPTQDHDPALVEAMLIWASDHWAVSGADGTAHAVRTYARDADGSRIALLMRHDFRCTGDHEMLRLERSLAEPIAGAAPPRGAIIRPLGGEDEIAAGIAVHHAVRPDSAMTAESYRRMRAVVGFRPDLDLIAVAPDGVVVSYSICWLDPINQTGLFEPVGTRAAYRRRGFGRAMIAEGLQRLRAAGARTAFVCCTGGNDAARALYESAGFGVVDCEHAYEKRW